MAGLTGQNLRVPKTIKLFIGGEFPRTESGRSFDAVTKKGKRLYAHLCQASRKDLRNAVTAAQGALSGWKGKTAYNRSQILYRMAEMAEGKRQEYVETFIEVLGYTPVQAHKAVDQGIDAFVYYAGFADKYQALVGTINPVAGPHHCFSTPEPVGVVGMLFDGKFDFPRIVAEISSVICSGNTTVVLLPEEGAAVLAPLAETFATSDLPNGVVNLLTGYLDELYMHFGNHMEIQALSASVGSKKKVAELQALGIANMKRVVVRSQSGTQQSLDRLLGFVEYKTVWHPAGF